MVERAPDSHKGENGKVAIIGGSRHQHGAPLFAGLAAEASGVDLVYVCVPRCHAEVAKMMSLNFQVHPFVLDDINHKDTEPILELLATMDSAVIGPGLTRANANIMAMREIIASAACALVLDATALQPETLKHVKGKNAVLTPHLGELERMGLAKNDLEHAAYESGAVIILKGREDTIINPDGTTRTVSGGNAGLTVGGTGDALAGLIAGLIAQRMEPFSAAVLAAETIKRAGEVLYEKKGYAYTARDVIGEISGLLR